MSPKVVLAVLMACTSLGVVAAEDPANSKLLKQCESAKGQVKRECEEVAKKMMKEPQQERTDKTDQDITHSSPVMKDEPAKPAPPKSPPPKE